LEDVALGGMKVADEAVMVVMADQAVMVVMVVEVLVVIEAMTTKSVCNSFMILKKLKAP
jgi:hypothetical protein